MSQGPTQGQGMQGETQTGPELHALIRALRWNVLYLCSKDGLVNSDQKGKDLSELPGALIRGAEGEGPGSHGRLALRL